MQGSWNRGRLGRIALALALAGLLVPNLVSNSVSIVRAADYAVPSFNIIADDPSEIRPDVGGDKVVWQDGGSGGGELADANVRLATFGEDHSGEKVNEGSDNSKRPRTDGASVVWTEQDIGPTGLDIKGYNIDDDDHFNVQTGPDDQDFPDVSGDRVVYQDEHSGNWDIKGYNIGDDDHFNVEDQGDDQIHPAIDGSLVCWEDYRDGGSNPNIFCRDVDGGDPERITNTDDATWPDVSGQNVVFVRGDSGDQSIYLYNREDHTMTKISTPSGHSRNHPRISGNLVVWMDERDGTGKQDIWGYDISTEQEFLVDDQDDDQFDPAIDGLNIAWTDESHSGDIRGGTLVITGAATATPEGTPVPPTPSGPLVPPPTVPHDNRYFPQTGFRVDNDVIFDFFNKRGSIDTFGFPVSRTLIIKGVPTQIFQRQVIEIGPDGNARLPNLLDAGLMPVNQINGSTFPAPDPAVIAGAPQPGSPNYDTAIIQYIQAHSPETFNGQPVKFFTTFNNFVTCADAFPDGDCQPNFLPGFNLQVIGSVTSAPTPDPANGGFIYLRFQRTILHYRSDCQCTNALLLADYFKSVITGNNLPGDLDNEMQALSSPYLRQYNNGVQGGMNHPDLLPGSNMQNAFAPGLVYGPFQHGAGLEAPPLSALLQ